MARALHWDEKTRTSGTKLRVLPGLLLSPLALRGEVKEQQVHARGGSLATDADGGGPEVFMVSRWSVSQVPLRVVEVERWPEDPAWAPGTAPGLQGSLRRQEGLPTGEGCCFHSALITLLLGHTKRHHGMEVLGNPPPHTHIPPPPRPFWLLLAIFTSPHQTSIPGIDHALQWWVA